MLLKVIFYLKTVLGGSRDLIGSSNEGQKKMHSILTFISFDFKQFICMKT